MFPGSSYENTCKTRLHGTEHETSEAIQDLKPYPFMV